MHTETIVMKPGLFRKVDDVTYDCLLNPNDWDRLSVSKAVSFTAEMTTDENITLSLRLDAILERPRIRMKLVSIA